MNPRITIAPDPKDPDAACITINYSRHSDRGHSLLRTIRQAVWRRIRSAIPLWSILIVSVLTLPHLLTSSTFA